MCVCAKCDYICAHAGNTHTHTQNRRAQEVRISGFAWFSPLDPIGKFQQSVAMARTQGDPPNPPSLRKWHGPVAATAGSIGLIGPFTTSAAELWLSAVQTWRRQNWGLHNWCMRMSLLGHTVQPHRPNRKSPAPQVSKGRQACRDSNGLKTAWDVPSFLSHLCDMRRNEQTCKSYWNYWIVGHVPSWISLQILWTAETEWWNAYLHSVA